MAIQHFVRDILAVRPTNTWEYSPGCGLSTPPQQSSTVESYHRYARYLPEHRQKPVNLTESLTPREKVYDDHGSLGGDYLQTVSACAHGTHTVTHKAYNIGVFPHAFGQFGCDYDVEKARLHWAAPLRNEITSSKVNLGSSLAEYRESGKMFVSLAKGLHSAYRTLRGRMPRRKIRACSIPASVLQYNFGIAPLVGDLYSSVEVLRQRLNTTTTRRTSISIKKDTSREGNVAGFDAGSEGSFRQRATIYYDLDPESYIDSDFDFGNPIEWAWELIPFSFVVDWAIPIGEWLGAMDALKGVSNVRGTVTTKVSENGTYFWEMSNQRYPPGWWTHSSYEREVISSVPLPPFPPWKPSLSWKRILNGVSILASMSKTCKGGK